MRDETNLAQRQCNTFDSTNLTEIQLWGKRGMKGNVLAKKSMTCL